ncbi:hypothetical protein H5410_056778 [Solanum commersonii]|uniref:Uncharacterized protein n=1 Tax=Solanum commersonii TaxID=4109 RepID=A0A9J5WN91_SOLCO|nr:hypothetical protein H5410_056778 [Solanum commersonii]
MILMIYQTVSRYSGSRSYQLLVLISDETKTDNHTVAEDLVDQEEIGEEECAIDKEIGIDCRKAVEPTSKVVSELTNFIGTISRNPRFINLMYTSWHAVPKDMKNRMGEYINVRTIDFEIAYFISKFLIPVEGKKWVMTGLRDAWRQHKRRIKERCFDKNSTVEDMLKNVLMTCQKAMCEMNSQNRKKQK